MSYGAFVHHSQYQPHMKHKDQVVTTANEMSYVAFICLRVSTNHIIGANLAQHWTILIIFLRQESFIGVTDKRFCLGLDRYAVWIGPEVRISCLKPLHKNGFDDTFDDFRWLRLENEVYQDYTLKSYPKVIKTVILICILTL